jgi:hypothetical protein
MYRSPSLQCNVEGCGRPAVKSLDERSTEYPGSLPGGGPIIFKRHSWERIDFCEIHDPSAFNDTLGTVLGLWLLAQIVWAGVAGIALAYWNHWRGRKHT